MNFTIPKFLDPQEATVRGSFKDKLGVAWCVLDVVPNWGYVPTTVFEKPSGAHVELLVSVKPVDEAPPLVFLKDNYKRLNDVYFGPKVLEALGAPKQFCSFRDNHNVFSFVLRNQDLPVVIVGG